MEQTAADERRRQTMPGSTVEAAQAAAGAAGTGRTAPVIRIAAGRSSPEVPGIREEAGGRPEEA